MLKTTKIIIALFVLFTTAVMSGCGFKPRRASNLPPQLKYIYFTSSKPYNKLSIELRQTLKALKVHFATTQKAAPVTLQLSNIQFQSSMPNLTNTASAIYYPVSLNVTISLNDAAGNPIVPPQPFHLSSYVLLNNNQILIPNILREASQQLNREAVSLIYYWLTSTDTRTALSHPNKKKRTRHENSTQTTQHQFKK